MAGELRAALEGVKLDSVGLDSRGRVVISDPAVAERIKGLGVGRLADELAGNGICCGNGNCLSDELVSLLNRVVGGVRAG